MEMQINWLAFALAFVAQMVIGYLWFHPAVMGRRYAAALGKTYETMRPANAGLAYGLTAVLTLVFTMFMLFNVTGFGQEDPKFHTFQHGVAHGLLLTFFVFVPAFGTVTLFEGKSWTWFLTHVGHWALRSMIAGGILSLMR